LVFSELAHLQNKVKLDESKINDLELQLCTDHVQFKTSLAGALGEVDLLKTNLDLSAGQLLQAEEKCDQLKVHLQQLEDDKIEWKKDLTRLAKHIEELNGENIVLKSKGDRFHDELIRVTVESEKQREEALTGEFSFYLDKRVKAK